MAMDDFPHKELSYAIIGACFEVYNEMGFGFLEPVYQECLAIEFRRRGVSAEGQARTRLSYKGEDLRSTYIPDFLVDEKVVLELKAVERLTNEHKAQVINYLAATGLELALLVNFGSSPRLEYERIIKSRHSPPVSASA
jgi:GxxExxY protein